MPALRRVVYTMILYMAGGVSGNLKPLWKEACRRIKEGQPFTNATEDAMRIFLAGGGVKALDPRFPSRISKKKRNAALSRRNPRETERICYQCNSTSPEYGPGGMGGV